MTNSRMTNDDYQAVHSSFVVREFVTISGAVRLAAPAKWGADHLDIWPSPQVIIDGLVAEGQARDSMWN